MLMFDYDDRVRVANSADAPLRPGSYGWVIGVFLERPSGCYFERFPEGVIYSIEFEDGHAVDVHESLLAAAPITP